MGKLNYVSFSKFMNSFSILSNDKPLIFCNSGIRDGEIMSSAVMSTKGRERRQSLMDNPLAALRLGVWLSFVLLDTGWSNSGLHNFHGGPKFFLP